MHSFPSIPNVHELERYLDEVEYLCDRSSHGEGLVMKQVGERWEYVFFPTLAAANIYLDQQHDKTGMMVPPSNLEDIFVELTGRQLD